MGIFDRSVTKKHHKVNNQMEDKKKKRDMKMSFALLQ